MLYFYLAKVPPTEIECWTFTCDGVFLLLCWIWTLGLQLILLKAKQRINLSRNPCSQACFIIAYECSNQTFLRFRAKEDMSSVCADKLCLSTSCSCMEQQGTVQENTKKEACKKAVGVSLAITFIWHNVKSKNIFLHIQPLVLLLNILWSKILNLTKVKCLP